MTEYDRKTLIEELRELDGDWVLCETYIWELAIAAANMLELDAQHIQELKQTNEITQTISEPEKK